MVVSLLRFALRSLLRRPVQSALLLFALSVALAGCLTILAVLTGVHEEVRRDLVRVGMNIINVHVSPEVENIFRSPLHQADCLWMRQLSHGEVTPFRAHLAEVRAGTGASIATLLLETEATWNDAVPLEFVEGRFFLPDEPDGCVLDEWVADELFAGGPATGQSVTITRMGGLRELKVVGVVRDPFEIRKRFEEFDIASSARPRILRMMEFKSVYLPGSFESPLSDLHGALVEVPPEVDIDVTIDKLTRALGDRRDSVWIWARRDWVQNVLGAADIATSLANVIWMIVLLVTGIMIATVSLVAVRQRFAEIAIRRTEGARRSQVAVQLLLENGLLCAASAVLAILLSHTGSMLLEERYLSWQPVYRIAEVALVLGLGALVALLGTVLPAWRAACLDPVAVLQNRA